MLPGNNSDWEALYGKYGREKGTARLGLCLLYSIFDPRPDDVKLASIRDKIKTDDEFWIKPNRFGVLTVEDLNGVGEALRSFGITVSRQKTTRTPHTALLEMVKLIARRREDS